jgi:hypothetical protein
MNLIQSLKRRLKNSICYIVAMLIAGTSKAQTFSITGYGYLFQDKVSLPMPMGILRKAALGASIEGINREGQDSALARASYSGSHVHL